MPPIAAVPAAAQSSTAPYLYTPHATTTHAHAAHKTTGKTARHEAAPAHKAVPVLAPRHAGTPRRPARPASLRPAPKEKPAPIKPPAPPAVPKKPAPPPLPPDIGPSTGLKLPRYAALKSDDVNMRSGPGERYPVLWTYQRRDLPVRIEHEFDIWRQVEDMDGIKGWMQQGFIVGHRTFIITGTEDRTMRADAQDSAAAVAVLKPGVVGRIRSCEAGKDWCQVQVQDYRGWLKRSDFWGTDPGEAVSP